MFLGAPTIGFIAKGGSSGGGGGGITGANNGLSVSGGTTVQLGGGSLIHDTHIPLAGFNLDATYNGDIMFLLDSSSNKCFIGNESTSTAAGYWDSAVSQSIIGDFFNQGNSNQVVVDDLNRKLTYQEGSNKYLSLNIVDGAYYLGDINSANNGMTVKVDDSAREIEIGANFGSGNFTYIDLQDAAQAYYFNSAGKTYLYLDIAGNLYQFGDIDGGNNHTFLKVNDGTSKKFTYQQGSDVYLSLDIANGLYQMGDVSHVGNSTYFKVDDPGKDIIFYSGSNVVLDLNQTIAQYAMGDLATFGNGTFLIIDDTGQTFSIISATHLYLSLDITNNTYAIGDISGAGDNCYIQVQDGGGTGGGTIDFYIAGSEYLRLIKSAFPSATGVFLGGAGARGNFLPDADLIQLGDPDFASHTYSIAIGSNSIVGIARPASNNTVLPIFTLRRDTSNGGGVAVGIGCSIDFSSKIVDDNPIIGNRLISQMTNVGDGTEAAKFIIQGLNAGSIADLFVLTGAGALRLNAYGAGAATFDASGNITSVSDPRLKTDIKSYQAGLAELMQIQPISYRWNELSGYETEHEYAGFDAEEVYKVLGEMGSGIDARQYRTLQDRALIGMLVNSVKQQQKQIQEMQKTINNFKS